MNEQQAIEHIVKETCEACYGSDSNEKWRCDICGYKKAIEALEKQIPKKMEYDSRCEVYECPNCESKYDNPQNDGILCCAVCGQAIDWSVEE